MRTFKKCLCLLASFAIYSNFKTVDGSADDSSRPVLRSKRTISSCPNPFKYSANEVHKCYAVVTQTLTWDAAQANCRSLHPKAHLTVVNSALENQILSEILDDYNCLVLNKGPDNADYWFDAYWTSGRRINSVCTLPFAWYPKSKIAVAFGYTNWFVGEPSCRWEQENCLAFTKGLVYGSLGWNDAICSWSYCSVCELLNVW